MQSVIITKVIIVIPCFNEEQNLAATCSSLGFGNGLPVENSLLILVNNNSTDLTAAVAKKIKANSPINCVIVGFEKEQGFVPARHRGNLIAIQIAQSSNWNPDEILILQADADTYYSKNYVNQMKLKMQEVGSNFMIEACVDYPASFKSEYHQYIDLCSSIDNDFINLLAGELDDDNIVDDKAVGYRLSDYFKWGGHRREYTNAGDEIYAETSRLYMAAKTKGAKRVNVCAAIVFHSAHKIFRNPILHLATAGFPREQTWNKQWEVRIINDLDLSSLCSQLQQTTVMEAICTRKQHLLALFCLLTLHVNQVCGRLHYKEQIKFFDFLSLLPNRVSFDLTDRPGIFLSDVFDLIKLQGDNLVTAAYKI